MRDLAEAAQLASLVDETPEGRSIVVLAKELLGFVARQWVQVKKRLEECISYHLLPRHVFQA